MTDLKSWVESRGGAFKAGSTAKSKPTTIEDRRAVVVGNINLNLKLLADPSFKIQTMKGLRAPTRFFRKNGDMVEVHLSYGRMALPLPGVGATHIDVRPDDAAELFGQLKGMVEAGDFDAGIDAIAAKLSNVRKVKSKPKPNTKTGNTESTTDSSPAIDPIVEEMFS